MLTCWLTFSNQGSKHTARANTFFFENTEKLAFTRYETKLDWFFTHSKPIITDFIEIYRALFENIREIYTYIILCQRHRPRVSRKLSYRNIIIGIKLNLWVIPDHNLPLFQISPRSLQPFWRDWVTNIRTINLLTDFHIFIISA